MATALLSSPSPHLLRSTSSSPTFLSSSPRTWHIRIPNSNAFAATTRTDTKKRRNLVCAVNKGAEDAFKKTVEVDRLIDMLKSASDHELQKLVVENILAFNEGFWIRLAARTDTCKSDDDKQDLEELASSIMTIVDRVVHKTNVLFLNQFSSIFTHAHRVANELNVQRTVREPFDGKFFCVRSFNKGTNRTRNFVHLVK
ncbi:hypothetical protein Hanom_Chr12g01115571 [Helianthus anomalus]